jgi:hypothetical protein
MKLGVSYNLFDGEELIEGSIKQIRPEVDYISVVYQTISNFGNVCNPELINLLIKLKDEKLIDYLFEYKPILGVGGHFNEITKRNIGLSLSQSAGCTHHMSMDSDEYYLLEQFKFLKKEMIDGNYDSSYCQMRTYYKSWEYQLDPPEDYYVSLIYKLSQYDFFQMGTHSPVLVDPTRRMSSGKYKIFNREEIEMHHGSYIRKNIRTKLLNSSSKNNNWDINKIVDYYDNWKELEDGLLLKPFEEKVKLKKIKTLF